MLEKIELDICVEGDIIVIPYPSKYVTLTLLKDKNWQCLVSPDLSSWMPGDSYHETTIARKAGIRRIGNMYTIFNKVEAVVQKEYEA